MPLIEPRWTGNAFDRTEVLLLGGFWMLVGVRRNVGGALKRGCLNAACCRDSYTTSSCLYNLFIFCPAICRGSETSTACFYTFFRFLPSLLRWSCTPALPGAWTPIRQSAHVDMNLKYSWPAVNEGRQLHPPLRNIHHPPPNVKL